jgi:type II secretory pathway pseudopilin PulG
MVMKRKGQIWVETVIYTLIGISLIGIVLAIVTPKINEYKDRSLIEQTIGALNVFDSKIDEVLEAPGNKRKIEFKIKKGNFFINPVDDKIRFELENSKSRYSEPGIPIKIGKMEVTTLEFAKNYKIVLEADYSAYDITFDNSQSPEVKFTQATVPYTFFIENKGFDTGGELQIDITEG